MQPFNIIINKGWSMYQANEHRVVRLNWLNHLIVPSYGKDLQEYELAELADAASQGALQVDAPRDTKLQKVEVERRAKWYSLIGGNHDLRSETDGQADLGTKAHPQGGPVAADGQQSPDP